MKKIVITGIMAAMVLTTSVSYGSAANVMAASSSKKEKKAAKTDDDKDEKKEPEKIEKGDSLVIKTEDLSEDASFYPVKVDDTEMEVIAVKDAEGTIRTAFNTCQICYDSGNGYYKQEDDKLVCQNCGNAFTMDQVGNTSGGCNPWPILDDDRTVTDDEIQISYDFLKESSEIFANWKKD